MEQEPRSRNMSEAQEAGSDPSMELVLPGTFGQEGIVPIRDMDVDKLIELLSSLTQALTDEERLDDMEKRQRAVDQHLLRGGPEFLGSVFRRLKELENKQEIKKINLSMLAISGKLLSGLYLPGANLVRLIFTESDISGSNLYAANLAEAVATDSIMRGVIATGSNWRDAVIPGADLSGARFIGARLINTDMTDVIVDKDTNFAGARFIGTYLGGTDLSVANLTGAVFRGIRI